MCMLNLFCQSPKDKISLKSVEIFLTFCLILFAFTTNPSHSCHAFCNVYSLLCSCNLVSIPEMISFTFISFLNSATFLFSFSCFLVLVPIAWPYCPPNSCIISFSLPSQLQLLHYIFSFQVRIRLLFSPTLRQYFSCIFFSYTKFFYIFVHSSTIQKLDLSLHIIHL